MKKSNRDELANLHASLRDIVVMSGIQESHYDAPMKQEMTDEQVVELYIWLQQLQAGPYADVLAIWTLKPAEWWENMKSIFGQHKSREQRLLRAAQKRLRITWRKRYGKPSDEETANTTVEGTNPDSATPSTIQSKASRSA